MLDFTSSNKPKQTATDTLSCWNHMRRSFFSWTLAFKVRTSAALCLWCLQHNRHMMLLSAQLPSFSPFLSFPCIHQDTAKGEHPSRVTIKNILHVLLLLLPLWLAAPAGPHPQAWPREAGAPCPGAGCRSGPSCIPLRSRPQTAPCPLQGSTGIWCDRRVWLRHRQSDHKVQGCYRTSNKYSVNRRPSEAAV